MEFLKDYNNILLSLLLSAAVLGIIFAIISQLNSDEEEAPDPASTDIPSRPPDKLMPERAQILEISPPLFMLPHLVRPHAYRVKSTFVNLEVFSDQNEKIKPLIYPEWDVNCMVESLEINNGADLSKINVLPEGMVASGALLVKNGKDNWLCFVACERKSASQEDLFMYHLASGKLHRIGMAGYGVTELLLWKDKPFWNVVMKLDPNWDGRLSRDASPSLTLQYHTETEKLRPFRD